MPRRINQICNRLLMLGAVEQRAQLTAAMLNQVLDELELDGAMHLPRTPPAAPIAPVAPPPASPSAGVASGELITASELRALLAERHAQIAELQQAVLELANEQEAAHGTAATSGQAQLEERFAALEAKLLEQERTVRHTLTMLIEWIEADDPNRVAA